MKSLNCHIKFMVLVISILSCLVPKESAAALRLEQLPRYNLTTIQQYNPRLAAELRTCNNNALASLKGNWATRIIFRCSQWVRETMQKNFWAHRFALRAFYFGRNATETKEMFQRRGAFKTAEEIKIAGLRPCDIVFQDYVWNKVNYGHVGIIVETKDGPKVAENTFRYGWKWDARALTDISKFGTVLGVGRLIDE